MDTFHLQPLRVGDPNLRPLLYEISTNHASNHEDQQRFLQYFEDNMRRSQGIVLSHRDKALGLMLFRLKGNCCHLNYMYALERMNPEDMLTGMLEGLVSLVEADKGINTIRYSTPERIPKASSVALAAAGFSSADRMTMRLNSSDLPHEISTYPPGVRLVPWSQWLNAPAINMLHVSFRDSYEALWDRDLVDINGCQQYMSECFAGRMGNFDPDVSFMLQYNEQWIGLALATWAGDREGFIPAFGLAPEFAGRGIGSIMLGNLLWRFGMSSPSALGVELAVSSQNTAAVRLYQKFHFYPVSNFRVYYRHIH